MKIDQSLKYNKETVLKKIMIGSTSIMNKIIMHTAPHHDDILLSYYAYAMKNWKNNNNHVVYVTSGSNGVSDLYLEKCIISIDENIIKLSQEFSYVQILEQFVIAYHKNNNEEMLQCNLMMITQFIVDIFNCIDESVVFNQIQNLKNYFQLRKAGVKEITEIIKLKARIRESESDRKWMINKGNLENIIHFRSMFYHADEKCFFSAMKSDIDRFIEYLLHVKPDVITVALDPCGIGPKNHFLTLKLVAEALAQVNNKNIKIIGYRNVWSSFDIDEASMIIPVSEFEMHDMQSIFLNCFLTQKNTIFVGTDIDGNFADQARKIYNLQWQQVKKNLDNHVIVQDKEIVGTIFLKELTIAELLTLTNYEN